MTVRSVLRMGNPALLQVSERVTTFDEPSLHALISDMEDTMAHMDGAGLAAPQIGVNLRIVIFGQKETPDTQNPRYPDASDVPYTVLINPVLNFIGIDQEEGWEGCLSIPGMRGLVSRYKHLEYTGFDQFGQPIARTVSGFHARVVQHECDHLDGVLYPMKMTDLSTFGYIDEIFPNVDIHEG